MTWKASGRARSTISGTQPGYRDNLRPLLWLLQLKNGQVNGRTTPVGVLQTLDELDIDGIEILAADLKKLLTIHVERWRQEMPHRDRHLRQFTDLPDEIWQANRGSPPASTPPTGNPSERSTHRFGTSAATRRGRTRTHVPPPNNLRCSERFSCAELAARSRRSERRLLRGPSPATFGDQRASRAHVSQRLHLPRRPPVSDVAGDPRATVDQRHARRRVDSQQPSAMVRGAAEVANRALRATTPGAELRPVLGEGAAGAVMTVSRSQLQQPPAQHAVRMVRVTHAQRPADALGIGG